jgi:hypothetical protein
LFNRESDSLLTLDNNLKRKSDFVKSTQLVDVQSMSRENKSLQKFLSSETTTSGLTSVQPFVQDANPAAASLNLVRSDVTLSPTRLIRYTASILRTPTLSDSEDKILVTDRTIGQQNFNHPLSKTHNSKLVNDLN